MITVSSILAQNDRPIPSIDPEATVIEAARVMNEHKVGALVVCEGGTCRGIFTERDLLRCVAASHRNLTRTKIAEIMSRDLLVCTPEMDVVEARRIMALRGIRNLPVIGRDKQLVGMISVTDLDAFAFRGESVDNQYLRQYVYGRN